MIRKIGKAWHICYDATGQSFDGPFASPALAQKRLDSLRPVDRMLVSGTPPSSKTDREFLMGTENGRQFQHRPEIGNYYRSVAEKRGQRVQGKKYISQLARFPGDPEAFVSGRGDVQKVCEQRGWGSGGLVDAKVRPREEAAQPVDVASDIVDREVAKVPGYRALNKKQKREVKEKVKSRLKPSWKK